MYLKGEGSGETVHMCLIECLYKSSAARCLIFGLSLPLLLYFVYARNEGSDVTAHMRSLV